MTSILHLEDRKLSLYQGRYDTFAETRTARLAVAEAEAKKQDAASVEVFKKAGVEIKNMSTEEFNAWRAIAKDSSYKNFVENVEGGQALLDMALAVE